MGSNVDPSMLTEVGTRSEAADFIAMLATAEAFKLLAGYEESPSARDDRVRRLRDAHARSSVMYKLWMFDFDNTIARLEPEVDWAGGRLVLEPYLRSIGAPDELFARIPRGNLPLYDAYRKLARSEISPPHMLEALRHASEIIEKIELAGVDRAQPLEGAVEILAALKASGAAVAIVTSNSSKTVARWFDRNGGGESVDAIVGRDTLLGLKPAPDMLLRALEIFSLDRSGRRVRRRQRRRPPRRAKLRPAILWNRRDRRRPRSIARGRRHRNLRLARGAGGSPEPAGRPRISHRRWQPCVLR